MSIHITYILHIISQQLVGFGTHMYRCVHYILCNKLSFNNEIALNHTVNIITTSKLWLWCDFSLNEKKCDTYFNCGNKHSCHGNSDCHGLEVKSCVVESPKWDEEENKRSVNSVQEGQAK